MVSGNYSKWRGVRLLLVMFGLTLVAIVSQPKHGSALTAQTNLTLGYPHSQMPCEHYPYNVSGQCANYDWGLVHTQAYNHYSEISSRGYAYRNCTDYVAWKLNTIKVNVPHGLGNAVDWYSRVATNQRSTRAKVWDVAVRPGGYGHVAFVESISSVDSKNPGNDVITVSEYNFYGVGTGSIRTGRVAELGFTAFIDFGVHPAPKPIPAPVSVKPVVIIKPAVASPTSPKPTVLTAKQLENPMPVKPTVEQESRPQLTKSTPIKVTYRIVQTQKVNGKVEDRKLVIISYRVTEKTIVFKMRIYNLIPVSKLNCQKGCDRHHKTDASKTIKIITARSA